MRALCRACSWVTLTRPSKSAALRLFGHKAQLNLNLRGGTTPMLEGVDPSTLPWNHSSLLYLAPLPKGLGEVTVDTVTGEIIRARPSPRAVCPAFAYI